MNPDRIGKRILRRKAKECAASIQNHLWKVEVSSKNRKENTDWWGFLRWIERADWEYKSISSGVRAAYEELCRVQTPELNLGCRVFQNSWLDRQKGNLKGPQQTKRKNSGQTLDPFWTQQIHYQGHRLIDQNEALPDLASTQLRELMLCLKLLQPKRFW